MTQQYSKKFFVPDEKHAEHIFLFLLIAFDQADYVHNMIFILYISFSTVYLWNNLYKIRNSNVIFFFIIFLFLIDSHKQKYCNEKQTKRDNSKKKSITQSTSLLV